MAETMQFDLVSPERRLASVKASAVQIPGADGDMTAMPDHAPTITTLRPVPPGTEGAISLEGTAASLLGSGLMALVMLQLGLLQTLLAWGVVTLVGLLATLLESLIGAGVQQRCAWLSNELVNAIQTAVAALLAISAASMLSLVP